MVNSSGNVGIGTDSPNNFIHINGGAADVALQITNSATGATATDGFNITVENPSGDSVFRNRESANMRFFTANEERMRIDSSGRVKMPYQPSFLARPASNYYPSLGPGTLISLGDVKHNVGNHFNSSNSTFTAPVAGKYLTGLLIRWNTGDYGSWSGAYIVCSVGSFYSITQPGYDIDCELTVVLNLSANDTIKYYSWSTNTSNRLTIYSHAYAHLLG